jgi:protein gp37
VSTRIEWADESWNPVTGCTPVSEACEHCYALRMLGRNLPNHSGPAPTFHPDRLHKPLHWRKPRRVFVCSMSDLFHEAFTDEQRDAVFVTMALAWRHTFMVLTKRPGRMHRYMLDGRERIAERRDATGRYIEAAWSKSQLLSAYARTGSQWEAFEKAWPLPNIWLGVTAENQQRADERIPILLDTPAAVRFVSLEPMLGPVDLSGHGSCHVGNVDAQLDWVILGGQTGPGARPMQPEWALDVYRQCKAAGVPFFFKKWGAANHISWHPLSEQADMQATREFPAVQP